MFSLKGFIDSSIEMMDVVYLNRSCAVQVCALLSGGGYAEKVAVPVGQVFPIPPGISLTDAASFPEVACTVWSTVFMMSRLSAGETFLVTSRPTLA